jgi:hypothetical protein
MTNIRRFGNRYKFLNEAVERTIDKKLWASVSSGISKNYRKDMGASARPLGTRDQLIQKYVAALVQLKQSCPSTVDELRNSSAFPQWGKWLADNGVSIEEVQQLYNENCGKLPKAVIGNSSNQPTNNLFDTADDNIDDEDDDDLGFALGMTDDEYQEMRRQKAASRQQKTQQPIVSKHQPQVIDSDDDFDIDDEDDEISASNQQSNYQEDEEDVDDIDAEIDNDEDVNDIKAEQKQVTSIQQSQSTKNLGAFSKKASTLKYQLFDGTIYNRDNFFKLLDGCKDPDDALTALTVNQLDSEGIKKSDALVDLKALMRETSFCFVMRLFGEAGPIVENGEIVGLEGDVIWSEDPTDESYYIVAGDNQVAIFFKNSSGNLSEVYNASFGEFGFID